MRSLGPFMMRSEDRDGSRSAGFETGLPRTTATNADFESHQTLFDPIFCAYVGDDLRDIVAANAAKMFSVAAAYGFISDTNQIKEWESDYIIDSPLDLKNLIS